MKSITWFMLCGLSLISTLAEAQPNTEELASSRQTRANETCHHLINISTRASIQGGQGDTIAGFIISGTDTKRVLLRGWGLDTGVNPKVTVQKFPSGDLIASNDDWQTQTPPSLTLTSDLGLPNPTDAGVLLDLPAGAYTLTLSSVGNLGLGLVGVDAIESTDTLTTIKLINISTRAPILGGAGDVIAGFMISGTGTQQVIIRGWGLDSGVDTKLTVQKFPSGEVIVTNDNWQTQVAPAITIPSVYQMPKETDAAVLLNLPAGAYTAVLGSVGMTGLGLIGVDAIGDESDCSVVANEPPVASPISLQISSQIQQQSITLSGHDKENDTLQYELIAPNSGTGYLKASIDDPSQPLLYVEIEPDFTGSIVLPYRVTDGQLFSEPANVTLEIVNNTTEEFGMGLIVVEPELYTTFPMGEFQGDIYGSSDASLPTMPRNVDLSANFPRPGNQGYQNSCTAWATGYALKSYQEGREIGWSLDTAAHLFSPAFIYNQINGGRDGGAYIYKALDLIVNKGAATLATMPYNWRDYRTQPSTQAFQEAANYKAIALRRTNGTQSVKAALAERSPVVIGMLVYDSFNSLRGANSVYNTTTGGLRGGHAVTIVGYNDDKYGGAFKIINSWGSTNNYSWAPEWRSNWGDNGYFWLPYSFFGTVVQEGYVLTDANNPSPNPNPNPNPGNLPNLQVQSWSATYDPKPGGTGALQYQIINTGNAKATKGADVNLMLSTNTSITSNDTYVVYEDIQIELVPGGVAFRDQNNPLRFRFPASISAGTYYMTVWVDDLNEVTESIETDNISPAQRTVAITNNLPDLTVESWYAEWDDFFGTGNGYVEYMVRNKGTSIASGGWWIGLFFSMDSTLGNDDYVVFAETIPSTLEPNGSYLHAGNFNVYYELRTQQPMPAGTYYVGLVADYVNNIQESSESNNFSMSGELAWIDSPGTNPSGLRSSDRKGRTIAQAYNGKPLPKNAIMRKVQITDAPNGIRSIKMLNETTPDKPMFDKEIQSANQVIFPVSESIPMPLQIDIVEPRGKKGR